MNARLAATIGAALLLVGLVVGLMPVSRGGVSCGSAYHASGDANVSDLASTLGGGAVTNTADDCDSLRSILRIPSVVLLLGGGIFVAVAATNRRRV